MPPGFISASCAREISRGDPKTRPAYPLPVALEDLSKVSFEVAGKRYTIADYIERNRVAGLLVIHNGKIAYERYAHGHTAASKWTSFSVAKSLTSMLVGAAMAFFNLTPAAVIEWAGEFIRSVIELGFEAFGDVGRWILYGAVIVVPLWLISRLLARR